MLRSQVRLRGFIGGITESKDMARYTALQVVSQRSVCRSHTETAGPREASGTLAAERSSARRLSAKGGLFVEDFRFMPLRLRRQGVRCHIPCSNRVVRPVFSQLIGRA